MVRDRPRPQHHDLDAGPDAGARPDLQRVGQARHLFGPWRAGLFREHPQGARGGEDPRGIPAIVGTENHRSGRSRGGLHQGQPGPEQFGDFGDLLREAPERSTGLPEQGHAIPRLRGNRPPRLPPRRGGDAAGAGRLKILFRDAKAIYQGMAARPAQTAQGCLRSRSSTALLSSARHVDGRDLYVKAASGANIHAGVIGEAQSCRSIAAVIENKGIARALEAYSGPAGLLGDDNIILRITADREINAVAAVVGPNDIAAVTLGKID